MNIVYFMNKYGNINIHCNLQIAGLKRKHTYLTPVPNIYILLNNRQNFKCPVQSVLPFLKLSLYIQEIE